MNRYRRIVPPAAAVAMILTTAAARWPAPPRSDLIVHEWGTFTSVAGSDGVLLPGLEREEEALPASVEAIDGMPPPLGVTPSGKGWQRPLHNVTIKMETPVLYFYAGAPLHARADVRFHGGAISQWYPPRSRGEVPPAPTAGENGQLVGGDIDFAGGHEGSIGWDFDILGPGDGPATDVFRGDETLTWVLPRLTDGNRVRTADGATEKYLFYRGIGNFALPLRTTVKGGRLTLSNTGADAIPFALVFRCDGDGNAAFKTIDGIPPGIDVDASGTSIDGLDPGAMWRPNLYAALHTALTSQGLYPKEADAMIQTWWHSYFNAAGLRVFWIVPRPFLDRTLPLDISPRPRQIERVLVGRSEVLTTEFEAALLADFNDEGATVESIKAGVPPAWTRWATDRFGGAYEARAAALSR